MEKIKFVVYCRKSSTDKEKQVQSIPDQLKELDKIVQQKNIKIVKIYTESRSAKIDGRPVFNEMIEFIKKGNADGIVCWDLSRLSRNPRDTGEIQALLQEEVIKMIVSPTKVYLPTDNVIVTSVELGFANQYIMELRKGVKRGMKSKAEKGWRPHTAPLGYLNDKFGDKGDKRIFIDPERFSLVRKMWDYMLTGNYSVMQIIKLANNEWGLRSLPRKNTVGKNLSVSLGYKIFTNSFYFGEFEYGGTIYQGKHNPMIIRDEYDKVQSILGAKGKPRAKYKRFPFNGVIECGECGGMVTTEEKFKTIKSKDNEVRRYVYHHCSKRKAVKCGQKSIKEEKLETQIKTFLNVITIPDEFLHWSLEALREQNELEINDRNIILKNLQDNFRTCTAKIDNLIQLYVSPNNTSRELLSDEEYKSQKNAVMTEKNSIEAKIRKLEQRIDDWVELTEKTFHFATYAKYWFEKGDSEQKTQLLRALGQNFILKDEKLNIELKDFYLIVKKGLENQIINKYRLELNRNELHLTKNSLREAAFKNWSG